jgi:hypothetical protein
MADTNTTLQGIASTDFVERLLALLLAHAITQVCKLILELYKEFRPGRSKCCGHRFFSYEEDTHDTLTVAQVKELQRLFERRGRHSTDDTDEEDGEHDR